MEHLDIVLAIASLFSGVIMVLLGRLVWISNEQRKEQKEQNLLNADEHKAIFERLTKGIGWFDSLRKDVERNGEDIKGLDKKVDKHSLEIVKIKDKIDYKLIN